MYYKISTLFGRVRFLHILLTGFVLSSLFGCSSMSDKIKNQYKQLPETLKRTTETVKQEKGKYATFKRGESYNLYSAYASPEAEDWESKFASAARMLDRCQELLTELKPLMDDNRPEDENKAWTKIKAFNAAVKDAKDLAKFPLQRMAFIREARKNAPQYAKAAKKANSELSRKYNALNRVVQQNRQKPELKRKKGDLATRLAPITQLVKDTRDSLGVINAELKKKTPNYARIADNHKLITSTNPAKFATLDKELRGRIAQLNDSYEKILVDMWEEYFVIIKRVSWDEDSDWNTEKTYSYIPRKVDGNTYEYFDDLPETQGFAERRYWGSEKILVDKAMADKLGTFNFKESWPSSSHDYADYWIETQVKYYHRYEIVKNGVKQKTQPVEEVSEAFYNKHWGDEEKGTGSLGMTIVSKPYGYYEEEKMTEPAPPGMAYVGNPKYGQWKQPSDGGDSFWEFYGKWSFFNHMFGYPYYSYGYWYDYDTNYRGRRGYYGSTTTGGYRTFGSGSKSVRSSPKMASSRFARQGGFKEHRASIRSAGKTVRGKGPKGRGK